MIGKLSPLQSNLLEIFRWFDEFCRQNQLKYYAIGGTLLGTLRHQGFIPWDDDLDVGMPRKDYERFMLLMKNQKGRYQYESIFSENDDYCYTMGKLYDTQTTLIEQRRRTIKRGMFIDIFPLDGLGNSLADAKHDYFSIKWRLAFHEALITCIRPERNFWKNAFIRCVHIIPSFLVNTKELRLKIDSLCSAHDFSKYTYGGNLLGTKFEGEIVPLQWFGEPKEAKFEDLNIYIPFDSDSYLKHIYGDWKKLPPKEKQITAHDFIVCDLNTSYLD